ncbi:hypothetical protein LTR95_002521 [Oleoguttula sp. CCFEE 5521]
MASHNLTNNIKTSCLIISDTHNCEIASTEEGCPLAQKLPKVDVLLHCGDLTQVGNGEYWATHLDEDDEPEEHDEAFGIMTGKLAKEAGVTYLTEGTHQFTLSNGATFSLFASPYQPECGEWAFGYPRNVDHFASKISENIDIMMTHGPPTGILDLIPTKNEHVGCDSLLKAVELARPKLHCFGHIHEGYGYEVKTWGGQAEEGGEADMCVSKAGVQLTGKEQMVLALKGETLMVNAAIMDDSNRAVNAPWVVEMGLPRKA